MLRVSLAHTLFDSRRKGPRKSGGPGVAREGEARGSQKEEGTHGSGYPAAYCCGASVDLHPISQALLAATAPEEDSPAEGFYRADDDTELFSAKGKRAAVDDDDDDELVLYRCEACSKTFKVM